MLARDSLVGDNHPRKQNDITLWITQNSKSIMKMLCRWKLHSNWGSALTVWNASKCLNSHSREGMLVSGDFQIFRRQRSKKETFSTSSSAFISSPTVASMAAELWMFCEPEWEWMPSLAFWVSWGVLLSCLRSDWLTRAPFGPCLCPCPCPCLCLCLAKH